MPVMPAAPIASYNKGIDADAAKLASAMPASPGQKPAGPSQADDSPDWQANLHQALISGGSKTATPTEMSAPPTPGLTQPQTVPSQPGSAAPQPQLFHALASNDDVPEASAKNAADMQKGFTTSPPTYWDNLMHPFSQPTPSPTPRPRNVS